MDSGQQSPPGLSHVLETVLYVQSKSKSVEFYRKILGLNPVVDAPDMAVFALGNGALLLFELGTTTERKTLTGPSHGSLPSHGPTQKLFSLLQDDKDENSGTSLRQHFCLAVQNPSEVDEWEAWLKVNDVEITGKVNWARGGKSVYFSDPNGHVGEIGSRGIWPHY